MIYLINQVQLGFFLFICYIVICVYVNCSHMWFLLFQKKLRLLNSAQFDNPSSTKHLPVLYVEQDVDPALTEEMQQGFQRMLFPPASNHKNEFHVLKFYSFSSSLVSAVLSEIDAIVSIIVT